MALGEPPEALKDAWRRYAAREAEKQDALIELPKLIEKLNNLIYDELSLRRRHVQSEKLLQRAAALFEDAWDLDIPAEVIREWTRKVGRWMSDYERRDEWMPNGTDNQD